jgi:hypothetical protein
MSGIESEISEDLRAFISRIVLTVFMAPLSKRATQNIGPSGGISIKSRSGNRVKKAKNLKDHAARYSSTLERLFFDRISFRDEKNAVRNANTNHAIII